MDRSRCGRTGGTTSRVQTASSGWWTALTDAAYWTARESWTISSRKRSVSKVKEEVSLSGQGRGQSNRSRKRSVYRVKEEVSLSGQGRGSLTGQGRSSISGQGRGSLTGQGRGSVYQVKEGAV